MQRNEPRIWPDRRAIWRWHFYAGIICIPFIVWLAATGSVYLFKPQIEAAIDAPFDHLHIAKRAPPSAQVEAALAAVPGAHFATYIVAQTPDAAARVLVKKRDDTIRVYVHPETLKALKIVGEEDRFMRKIFRLHGELLIGDLGSAIVEIAACWAIILLLTGLVLWWPQGAKGVAGILYPRLRTGGRLFWRDLHAVTGFWVSACALFLLATGLPWAKVWGDYFKQVRTITHTLDGSQDWANGAPAADPHAEHMHGGPTMHRPLAELDRVTQTAIGLNIAPPVLISRDANGMEWTAKSDSQNRPLRSDATLDGETGKLVRVRAFNQRHPIDQAVGYGVAAHEGQLFGAANQALSLVTALSLILLSVSAVFMWFRRRPPGTLGAPLMLERPRFSFPLVITIATLAVLFPLLAASLATVWIVERVVLRRFARVRDWLGLDAAAPSR